MIRLTATDKARGILALVARAAQAPSNRDKGEDAKRATSNRGKKGDGR